MTDYLDMQGTIDQLAGQDNILILCHKNPDGDTIGSAGALYWALRALEKTAAVLCSDPIPQMYNYMMLEPFTKQFKPKFVVAVDVASIQLFGENNGMQEYSDNVNLCIDHHGSNAGYAYCTLLDEHAAACCEILTELIPRMGVTLDPQIAGCLYTGIATDTGCFKFSATTAHTHVMAARLMEAGANVEDLNAILFESKSRPRVEVERMALESLEYYFGNRCAMICLTKEQIAASGVPAAELEDITSLPRGIEGVMVGLTLRQQPLGSYKISVRTTKELVADSIVRRLGGGGHNRAAGCEIEGMQENVKAAILKEVERALSEFDQKRIQQEEAPL